MAPARGKSNRFPDTHWSLLGRADASDAMTRQQAVSDLLSIYTPALRSLLVASHRVPMDLADDLVHDFVTDKILGRKLLHHVDQNKGKFRNYLVKALNNFVTTKLKREYADRAIALGLDLSCVDVSSSEHKAQFDWEWIQLLVHNALALMEADCTAEGRGDVWEIFRVRIVEPLLYGTEPMDYGELIQRLRIGTPRQAINLLVTAKRSFLRHLRMAIGQYVHESTRIDVEIADLREIVGR